MKVEKNISIRQYAATLNINESAVRKAITDGKIKKGYDTKTKKINPVIANKEYGNLHKVAKPRAGQSKVKLIKDLEGKKGVIRYAPAKKAGTQQDKEPEEPKITFDGDENLISSMQITSTMPYSEALRRRELIGLVEAKMKLQELEKSLVKKDDVERALFVMADLLKKALLNIPARTTADIRCAGNEVEAQQILTVEIIQVLNQYSNIKELKV